VQSFHHDLQVVTSAMGVDDIVFEHGLFKKIQFISRIDGCIFDADDAWRAEMERNK